MSHLNNQNMDWCESIIDTGSLIALNQEIAVGRTLNILYFAANQTTPFQAGNVVGLVDEVSNSTITRYLNTLVKLQLLEKVTCFKYQATARAKKMMNIGGAQ
ncbi:hypothetical protein EXE30_06750 [Acinetobacter halotolerans]|uniref:MarR family transcriptional regulator n=1 Tax=Acinetobacter halotolerans TaxID=1752076 RepID=A0A4Q6XBH4_9GAMM|nr:hypothetical protein [Acinetobacter halotolerans]RZF53668.1 hypothetical protein EXE30_06750 [Acinetobacter halotolerans]